MGKQIDQCRCGLCPCAKRGSRVCKSNNVRHVHICVSTVSCRSDEINKRKNIKKKMRLLFIFSLDKN